MPDRVRHDRKKETLYGIVTQPRKPQSIAINVLEIPDHVRNDRSDTFYAFIKNDPPACIALRPLPVAARPGLHPAVHQASSRSEALPSTAQQIPIMDAADCAVSGNSGQRPHGNRPATLGRLWRRVGPRRPWITSGVQGKARPVRPRRDRIRWPWSWGRSGRRV
jgi:hypothetical protein